MVNLFSGFKLTTRDIEILQFVNEFGFCEMPHLDARFGLCKPRNYQVVGRLVKAGLLRHERVFYGRHGIYRLTPRGAKLTDLPALAKIPMGNYSHCISLIEVYLKLRELYPEADWVSERHLMHDKHFDGVGKRGHVPDGILVFADGKQVAIEVELTLKGRQRLESILKSYGAAFGFSAVWYYAPKKIAGSIGLLAAKMAFIKIHTLEELLG